MRHELIPFGTNRMPANVMPFDLLQDRMGRMLEDVWRDLDGGVTGLGTASFAPKVDVGEDENSVHVTADIPGLSENDLEVDFADGALRIAGEKTAEHTDEQRRYAVTERAHGRFERRIPIGREIDHDRVDATFRDGVLRVTLPKLEQGQAGRRIKVSRG